MSEWHARWPLALAALWWASLTTLGAWVVPLLFVHLPSPALAGGMAAHLFAAQTWVSLLCGLGLLLAQRVASSARTTALPDALTGWLLAGLLLALLLQFAVAPRIVARQDLHLWHTLGTAMYALQWVCAVAVFWKLSAPGTKP
jgi:hypothetical protein